MKLREHLIIGGVAAAVLYPQWGFWRAFLFYGAAVLIDADHYWDYLWRNKFQDWSGWRMFRYYNLIKGRRNDDNLFAFSLLHTVEVFGMIYLLAHFWNYAFFITIFWGVLFHMLLDIIDLTSHKVPFIRAFSIVEYLIRKKAMVKKGLNPDGFFKEIFKLSG